MKGNKKGFTLIELLAVIVILAVIALIAVPVVMNIINKANKSAFKDTAYGIIKAGELYFAEQQLQVDGMSEEKTFHLSTDVNTETGLQINGTIPQGILKINEKGEIALAINNGRYCITKGYADKDITVTEDLTNCNIPGESKILDDIAVASPTLGVPSIASCVTDGTTCAPGTALAIRVKGEEDDSDKTIYKFRVLNDDGEKVTLIMTENLGNDIYWNNEQSCETYEDENGEEAEDCWYDNSLGPKEALAVLKGRTQNWTNITEYSYTLDYGTGTYSGEYVKNIRARLPKVSDFEGVGCSIPDVEAPVADCPIYEDENHPQFGLAQQEWLLDGLDEYDSYWLSDASYDAGEMAWYVLNSPGVSGESGLQLSANGGLIYEEGGIRPVIIVSK